MLDFPRWKVISILLLLGLGIALAIPSLMPERTAQQLGLGRMPRINLGLDLAGGSHLVLDADVSGVGRQSAEAMEGMVRDAMARGPAIEIGDISYSGDALSFLVRNPQQVDTAVERARLLTQPIGVTGQRDWDVAVVDSTRIVMTQSAAGIAETIESSMQVAVDVIRTRIDSLGTREPTIVRQGARRIVVQVPGLDDPNALKALLGKTAQLEFKLVDETVMPEQIAAGRAPAGSQILPYPDSPTGIRAIAVKRRALITGERLVSAQQRFNQENNSPVVVIRFDAQGANAFGRITQANLHKPFAMILDGVVLSAPVIRSQILDGTAEISGNFTVESATELAISLSSGKLPIPLKVVEERTVGPQLGADSIRAGVLASTVATILVIAFMILTYGRFGIYATSAVVINILVIVGVMALFNATLTLPGIAGFVLTIGTAVDANVLINERIREERRRGRSIVQSVELGYKEASRTIFEANVTHAIAGLVMLWLGSGPVKGFAIVLLIGIATSVFTAVTYTRMLVTGWLRRKQPTTINI